MDTKKEYEKNFKDVFGHSIEDDKKWQELETINKLKTNFIKKPKEGIDDVANYLIQKFNLKQENDLSQHTPKISAEIEKILEEYSNSYCIKEIIAKITRKVFNEQIQQERIVISSNELLKKEIKQAPFLLDKMIVENGINALTSDNGKGKSLFMLKMATSIARGEKFLGEYETKKTNILIMDLEMSENDIIQRTHSIIQEPITGLDFYHCQSFDIENSEDFNWLTNQIKLNQYGLVVIDTFNTFHHREENSNSEMRFVNKKLIELVNKHNATILFLHHHRKPQKGEKLNQATSRGAGEIIAKASSHLLLDSVDKYFIEPNGLEQSGLHITIEQFKARQVDKLDKFGVDVWYNKQENKTKFKYTGQELEAERAEERAEKFILSTIEENEEWSFNNLMEEKDRKNIKMGEKTLRDAIRILVNNDKLSEKIGKQNKKLYFLPL